MYYALTTLSTVGFGDFHPENSYERLICAFIMIFGNAIFGYIIGLFKQMIMENDKQTSDQFEDADELNKFFSML
jgi:hypothetical protein